MKRQIATWLALSCLLSAFSPVMAASAQADGQQTVIKASTEKTQVESKVSTKPEMSDLSIHREFTYVAPEQIPMQITAVLEQQGSTTEDVNNKILGGYLPVLITVTNKTDKLIQIPSSSIYFVDAKGNTRKVPNQSEVFGHVRRHGVRRALAWSVPLGIASFGILLIPAAIWSGVHTGVTNSSLKNDVQRSMLRDGHLSPEGVTRAYVFIPKSGPDPVKLIFGRVINTENEIETEKVTEITTKETIGHVDAK